MIILPSKTWNCLLYIVLQSAFVSVLYCKYCFVSHHTCGESICVQRCICIFIHKRKGGKGRERHRGRERERERTIYLFIFGGDSFLSHLSLIFGFLCYTGCSQSISMASIVLTSYLWLHSYLPTYLPTHIQSYPFSAREQT